MSPASIWINTVQATYVSIGEASKASSVGRIYSSVRSYNTKLLEIPICCVSCVTTNLSPLRDQKSTKLSFEHDHCEYICIYICTHLL